MENPRAWRTKVRRDRQCHRKQTARGFSQEKLQVRVKRRGKSPPPAQQCAGHEKPSAVQDKTGGRVSARFTKVDSLRVIVALAARAPARAIGRPPPGGRREMIVPRRASGADRIRLIASKRGRFGKPGRPHSFRRQAIRPLMPAQQTRTPSFLICNLVAQPIARSSCSAPCRFSPEGSSASSPDVRESVPAWPSPAPSPSR